jgi:hypothetical protein
MEATASSPVGRLVVVDDPGYTAASVGDLVQINIPVGFGSMMRPSITDLDVQVAGSSLRPTAKAYTERRTPDGGRVYGGGNLSAFLAAEAEGVSYLTIIPIGPAAESPLVFEIQVGPKADAPALGQ